MYPERYPLRQSADDKLYNNVEYVVFRTFDNDIKMSYYVMVHWTQVFDYMDRAPGYGGDVTYVVWDERAPREYHGLRGHKSFASMLSDSKTGKAVAITGSHGTILLRRKDI